ncbi:hypothetical protein CAOG_08932 [Capsaspora owczarzaki ATCC 30864]|nr:hypothetical protein CAOG_08932 [Capsaspora owczarzaki ATCC 30864]|eukprot:XP_011270603.1 hypothetical protein CAOG_08932 [Capsaspora owczarzaki ATCC 30864]
MSQSSAVSSVLSTELAGTTGNAFLGGSGLDAYAPSLVYLGAGAEGDLQQQQQQQQQQEQQQQQTAGARAAGATGAVEEQLQDDDQQFHPSALHAWQAATTKFAQAADHHQRGKHHGNHSSSSDGSSGSSNGNGYDRFTSESTALTVVPSDPSSLSAVPTHPAALGRRQHSHYYAPGPLQVLDRFGRLGDPGHMVLLVLLYVLQGVPLGLVGASIPFLLQQRASYTDLAVFSLAGYPYSLKLLWSPIVDSVYWAPLGRRKTWILPTQTLLAVLFVYLGSTIEATLAQPDLSFGWLSVTFFVVIMCAATQDIAVDGLAIEVLSPAKRAYSSTCQSIGLTAGYFISFTVFLAFNSVDFCNSYFRSQPQDWPIIQLGPFMMFWGVMYATVTGYLVLVYQEPPMPASTHEQMSISFVYMQLLSIVRSKQMRVLISVLLVQKIGFLASDVVSMLKLVEKGFDKTDLGLVALIDFPCQLILGIYVARWTSGSQPLKPWLSALYGRLFLSLAGVMIVWSYPSGPASGGFFTLIAVATMLLSITSTAMFVAQGAFFARISDASIGGTYMTLLNTVSNFGGTWPKFFILRSVDMLTVSHCEVPDSLKGAVDFVPSSCVSHDDKQACHNIGGSCVIDSDGFYFVAWICFVLGAVVLFGFVRRVAPYLESADWRPSSAATTSLPSFNASHKDESTADRKL